MSGEHTHPAPDLSGYATVGDLLFTHSQLMREIDALTARVHALENPAPPAADWWDVPGWRNTLHDDFAGKNVPWGAMVPAGTTPTAKGYLPTVDPLYLLNPTTWFDTSRQGQYSLDNVRQANGEMLVRMRTVAGVPRVTKLVALPEGCDRADGGITGPFRYLWRIRADVGVGFKVLVIGWPTKASGGTPTNPGGDMLTYGELDWPEVMNLTAGAAVKGYMHRVAGTSSGDQDVISTPAGTSIADEHDYVLELWPGVRARFLVDGLQVANITSRVPGGSPFRVGLQCETTATAGDPLPDPALVTYVSVKRVAMWVPA